MGDITKIEEKVAGWNCVQQHSLVGGVSQFLSSWREKMCAVPKSSNFPYTPEQWNAFFDKLEPARERKNDNHTDNQIASIESIAFRHRRFSCTTHNGYSFEDKNILHNGYSFEDENILHYTCRLPAAPSTATMPTFATIEVSLPSTLYLSRLPERGTMNDTNPDKMDADRKRFRLENTSFCDWSTPITTLAYHDFFGTLKKYNIESQYHLGLFLLTFEHHLHLTPSSQQLKLIKDGANELCSSLNRSLSRACVIL